MRYWVERPITATVPPGTMFYGPRGVREVHWPQGQWIGERHVRLMLGDAGLQRLLTVGALRARSWGVVEGLVAAVGVVCVLVTFPLLLLLCAWHDGRPWNRPQRCECGDPRCA